MKRRLDRRLLQDLLQRGRIARYAGRHAEARLHYSEALESARAARDWSLEAEALGGLGSLEIWNDPGAARELLTRAAGLIEPRGKPARLAGVRVQLALACLDAGDSAAARTLLEWSLPILAAQEQELAVAFGTEVLAMVLVAEGRPAKALERFWEAAGLRRQPGGEEASPLRWRQRRDATIARLRHETVALG